MKSVLESIKRYKEQLLQWLYCLAIITIAFVVVKPPAAEVLAISVVVWIIILIRNKPDQNRLQYLRLCGIALATESAFILMKLIFTPYRPKPGAVHWLHILYFLALLAGMYRLAAEQDRDKGGKAELPKLYPERERDLRRLSSCLDRFRIIGVDGDWGSGKTLIMNTLKADEALNRQYIFITIPLLSCNLDELPTLLIGELDHVLRQNRIFSVHSAQVRGALQGNDFINWVSGLLLPKDQTYTDAMRGFCEDILRLKKTIVIDFEDIDRINDAETVKKVFSIAESLTNNCEAVKVVYEYSQTNLEAVDPCFTRAYVEKYIPFTMRITEMPFVTMLKRVLEGERYRELNLNDFSFLWRPLSCVPLNRSFFDSLYLTDVLRSASVRKVEHFLDELCTELRDGPARDALEKRVVIVLTLMKHLDDETFRRLNLQDSLADALCVIDDGKAMSVPQLLQRCDAEGLTREGAFAILKRPENLRSLTYLLLFEYDLSATPASRGLLSVLSASERQLKAAHRNERIDRLVWHLLARGKSEYTDRQAMLALLDEMVLSRPEAEQRRAFSLFLNECFNERFNDLYDNRTPFRLGVQSYVTIFQSLRACDADDETWIRFLRFYFSDAEVQRIDLYLIANLSYCPLENPDIYMMIVRAFNGCDVAGNMNRHELYWRFLRKYLSAMSGRWTAPSGSVLSVREEDEEGTNADIMLRLILPEITRGLAELREALPMESVRADIDQLTAFVEKNEQIIRSTIALKAPDGAPRVESIRYESPENEALERLKRLPEDERLKAAGEYYENRQVSAYELHRSGILK